MYSYDLSPLINVIYKRYKEYKCLHDFRKEVIAEAIQKYKLYKVSSLSQLCETVKSKGDVSLVTAVLTIMDSEDKRIALAESIEEVANLLYNSFVNEIESCDFLSPDFMDCVEEEEEEYYNDVRDCYEELEQDVSIDFIRVNELPQCGMLIIYDCGFPIFYDGIPFKIGEDMLKVLIKGSAKPSICLADSGDIYDIEDIEDEDYEDD